MGKNIISQRRGRGTTTYRAHSFRWLFAVKHRKYDEKEKTTLTKGKIINLIHGKGHHAPIAIVQYENSEKIYMYAPELIQVNQEITSGSKSEVKIGNTLPLKNIPIGTEVHNVELLPGDGGRLCRTPGVSAKIIAKAEDHVLLDLPSKKQKKIPGEARATIGIIAGSGRKDKPWVKAGKRHHAMRARGKLYPLTSGVAMNAVDHPYGSGRGRHHSKIKPASQFAPPGRKVGPIRSKKTGRGKAK